MTILPYTAQSWSAYSPSPFAGRKDSMSYLFTGRGGGEGKATLMSKLVDKRDGHDVREWREKAYLIVRCP